MRKSKMPAIAAHARPGVRSYLSDSVLSRWNENLKAQEDHQSNENLISIMDVIGEDFWGDGVSAKRVSSQLRAFGEEDVIININSPGGNFFEGLAIYNLLRQHKGKVTVRIMGIAASAAAVIAMAGDDIQIARAGFLMIHNTWIMAAGDRHQFIEMAEWLRPFDETSAELFAARTGLEKSSLAAMLDKETWISGKQALDDGFADEFLEADLVENSPSNHLCDKPIAASHEVDQLLAKLGIPRSKRRDLLSTIKKSGMPSAAENATQNAGISEAIESLKSKIAKL